MVRQPRLLGVALIALLSLAACSGGSSPTPTPAVTVPPATVAVIPNTSGGDAVAGSTPIIATPVSETPATEVVVADLGWPTTADNLCPLLNNPTLTVPQLIESVACVITYFRWPVDYQIDLAKVSKMLFDLNAREPTVFENGMQFTMVSSWNECAWYRTWLDARASGDTVAQEEALLIMTEVIPNYVTVVPHFPAKSTSSGVDQGRRDTAAKARLGDPTAVITAVTYLCVSEFFEGWDEEPVERW